MGGKEEDRSDNCMSGLQVVMMQGGAGSMGELWTCQGAARWQG
jgi:hypothetical protein